MDTEGPDNLSFVLCSGTDDRLTGAAVLVVGAAAMGRQVERVPPVLGARRVPEDRISKDHGVAPEAVPRARSSSSSHGGQHWSELFRQAKDIGEVEIQACALSMEALHRAEDLDPLVDDQEGVAGFISTAGGASRSQGGAR